MCFKKLSEKIMNEKKIKSLGHYETSIDWFEKGPSDHTGNELFYCN